MTKQVINIGTAANAKNGDPLRTAFTKINANFTELYAGGADETQLTNGAYTLTLGANGNLTFPDATTTTGQSITIPTGNSLTVNLSNSSPGPTVNTTFKINPLSIRLQTGNGVIFSGVDGDAAYAWALDALNKTLYFPDAGDSVYPQIRYSTGGGDGMQLYTQSKPIKITISAQSWSFNTDGSLKFPDGTVQKTAGASKGFTIAMAVALS